jgi:hypothetical protein
VADQRCQAIDHRSQRRCHLGVSEPERIDRDDQPRGQRSRDRLAQQHTRNACERRGVAGEPAGGVGAWRLRQHAGEIEPPMRRADAVEAAEAGRHPHRAAGVGAKRGVAHAGGHRRSGTGRGTARHPAGRAGVERRAVECILAQNAERYLVGDGLADQSRAGIEQRLHRPGVARRHRVRARPVVVAAAGGVARDVEQIFRREGETVQRAMRRTLDGDARSGDKGVDRIIHP